MRSKPFQAVKAKAFRRYFVSGLDSRYERSSPTITATFIKDNQVATQTGHILPFDNRSGIAVFQGKSLNVVNVGRPAASLYVPAKNADT